MANSQSLEILKCHDCGDALTAREESYYYDFVRRQQRPPRCYQCGVKAFDKILKDRKKLLTDEERCEMIREQESRWGNAMRG